MIPLTGPISLFDIFREVYGRDPNIGERVSFQQCVADSTLADKSFPCPFSRFRGYQHYEFWQLPINIYVASQGIVRTVLEHSDGGVGFITEIFGYPEQNKTIVFNIRKDTGVSVKGLSIYNSTRETERYSYSIIEPITLAVNATGWHEPNTGLIKPPFSHNIFSGTNAYINISLG